MNIYTLLIAVISAMAGCAAAVFFKGAIGSKKLRDAEDEAVKITNAAKNEAESLIKEAGVEAKDILFKMKSEFELEAKETRSELKKLERRLIQKEENIDRKAEIFDQRENDIAAKESSLSERQRIVTEDEEKYKALLDEQKAQLERISTLTAEQAKELLIRAMENEARYEGAKLIKRIENEAKEEADKKAKKIMATAIQRYAGDFVAERTVSVVQLPGDEMKGRIIGREGRNIRAIEAATGIDLIIDDTPEAVILSGFNPVRREVARLSLIKLISDGRIHPARIEDVVKKVGQEVDTAIKEAGEQAAFDLGVHGIHAELIKYLGRLKYRTSYAQNVLQHSVEVGVLCGIMASELGLKEKVARRMGLLHDIGKAIDHEVEGPHAVIGSKLAKKFGESQGVVHAIAAHHEDVPPSSVYALLVQAADGLSGARPGARKELLENYIKRIEDLEGIANSFKGVSNTYAIQAGREIRVIVESEKVSDEESVLLSRDIAKKIEESLTFPGQIKVTVIRETRAVEYANK
ncbi:ribonuclease Y [Desulfosarcina ovata]|uniref:Ribonuclease Y n=2 Tax=Desulfosarcina ovata TaxID=83564 RepID=A0A5K8AJC9_9BACT|nr:ribonuclease Y [Desulfosarcina ovata]BBO85657.1 ribonuclease Y [Desulfosarcina ovata subsp. sediminis]BBO92698.1 ribonuclease Y [Desulfosarcina ovata subsp. ovata]